jgi:predicted nicotinamide N-methyase
MKHWRTLKNKLLAKPTEDEYVKKGVLKEISDGIMTYDYEAIRSKLGVEGDWPILKIEKPSEVSSTELKASLSEKVDHTGNVRVWPSEEFLAAWVLLTSESFEGQSILELGAGCAGLAGFALASKGYKVIISDGNPLCVQSLT